MRSILFSQVDLNIGDVNLTCILTNNIASLTSAFIQQAKENAVKLYFVVLVSLGLNLFVLLYSLPVDNKIRVFLKTPSPSEVIGNAVMLIFAVVACTGMNKLVEWCKKK